MHEFLRSRRSIRRFKPDAVPDSLIERILTTATYAPSAHNRQPWRFAVLTSAGIKACLAGAMSADFRRDLAAAGVPEQEIDSQVQRSERRMASAPVVIVLSMGLDAVDRYPAEPARSEAERMMAIQSVGAAAAQLLLAAHAEGLGANWICWPLFTPETVRGVLELPASWQPQAMFFIGYPAEDPKPKVVRPLAEVARFEHEGG